MAFDFARTIGDGYPDYVDDELGYNYHAWEVISASESRAHESIRRAEYGELDSLVEPFQPLSDLLRWTLARRRLDAGDDEAYFSLVDDIVDGNLNHPALHYPEVMADLARRRAAADDVEEGRTILVRIEESWPEFKEAIPLLEAQLLLFSGDITGADQAFDEALEPYPEDVDLRIETAVDFQRAQATDVARRWLDQARALAQRVGDDTSLVDIDLLERSLPTEDDNEVDDTSSSDVPAT